MPAEAASQALTVYFVAFAVGVFVWGYAALPETRRPDRTPEPLSGTLKQMLGDAAILLLGSALVVLALHNSVWFLAPMLLVVVAFGVAIPNVLGHALIAYKDKMGTAGALFGLMYYLMIGAGMMVTAWAQTLGETLTLCGVVASILCLVHVTVRSAIHQNDASVGQAQS